MNSLNVIQCSECRQLIDSEGDSSFVRFKIPGTEDYSYFHWRPRGSDCWEAYLKADRHCVVSRHA